MRTIAEMAEVVQRVLTVNVNELARESGFVRRSRQVSGQNFLQTLVFGWQANPQGSLEDLVGVGRSVGLSISPQGLSERFTAESAAFVQAALQQALEEVIVGQRAVSPLLEQFNGVYIQDSTVFRLPDELASLWQGCGGRIADQNLSALKVQLQWDYLTGQISGLEFQPGRQHDQQAACQQALLPVGSLRLGDLGYFNLALFAQMGSQRYWISRLKAHVLLFDRDGAVLKLESYLAHTTTETLDLAVQVGTQRLPCRLLAQRVPPKVAAERRRKLHAAARKKGQTVSQARLALADWTILLTNVPPHILSTPQVFIVAGVRWQIELVFKLWKSEFHMDVSRSQNPWRILTELFAKLLGWLIQHWLLLSQPQPPDRSPTKALHIARYYALYFANVFTDLHAFALAIAAFHNSIAPHCRINKSQKAPPTFLRLLHPTQRSLT